MSHRGFIEATVAEAHRRKRLELASGYKIEERGARWAFVGPDGKGKEGLSIYRAAELFAAQLSIEVWCFARQQEQEGRRNGQGEQREG